MKKSFLFLLLFTTFTPSLLAQKKSKDISLDFNTHLKISFYLTSFTDKLFWEINKNLAQSLPVPRGGLGQKREFTCALGLFTGFGVSFLNDSNFPMATGLGYGFTLIKAITDYSAVSLYQKNPKPNSPPSRNNKLDTKERLSIPVHFFDGYYSVQLNKISFPNVGISLKVSLGLALAQASEVFMHADYIDKLKPSENTCFNYQRKDQAWSLGLHGNVAINFHVFFVAIDYFYFPSSPNIKTNPLNLNKEQLKTYRSLNKYSSHNFCLDLGLTLNQYLLKQLLK